MKNTFFLASTLLTCIFSYMYGEGKNEKTDLTEMNTPSADVEKISEAFGHLIGKNLDSLGFNFDMQAVVQGLKDSSVGKSAPMTEIECIQAITAIQEAAFKEQSKVNLNRAEDFLKKNRKAKNIVCLEKGRVQYKVEKEGKGTSIKPNVNPVIRYVGKFLDGSVFGQSKEDEPISLEEMIPGLKQGMIGMKEGEKRTIYIHPELAYGTKGALPPNSLLTFEIEVVKTDNPIQEETLDSKHITTEANEVAFPMESAEVIR